MRYLKSHLFLIALSVMAISFSSCSKEDLYQASDSHWKIRFAWQDVYSVWDNTTDFYEDGTLRMIDKDGTYNGTWSQTGETVSWRVPLGEMEIYAKAYIDANTIQGTMNTSEGRDATLFGTRND